MYNVVTLICKFLLSLCGLCRQLSVVGFLLLFHNSCFTQVFNVDLFFSPLRLSCINLFA